MPPSKIKQTSRTKPSAPSTSKPGLKKGSPKKQLTTADRLKRLFASLCAQIEGGHFKNAIKTCDKIIVLDPQDKDAPQTKLFLLLQTDQYAPALAMVDSSRGSDGSFERAYSLYRLHREPEAKSVLKNLKTERLEDRGLVHLEAQLSYREGDYETAFDHYNHLLDTSQPQSEEHSDILTNLQAAQRHLDFVTTNYLRALDGLDPTTTSTLESTPPPAQPGAPTVIISAKAPDFAREAVQVKDAPRKVRARRVPKGVVPGVTPPPDPERWLKKSERSTFQQARGKKKAGGATQGVVESGSAPASSGQGKGGKGKKKK
ncbi:hypothetical protein OF83DRAFT_1055248 [Amylostereum chailletii]|nr:hypothetical protein OF83DRAFT_1055248 [Amylostereum chailletii]